MDALDRLYADVKAALDAVDRAKAQTARAMNREAKALQRLRTAEGQLRAHTPTKWAA